MDVLTPRSLDEALRLKSAHPEALPIQGGTDLMPPVDAELVEDPEPDAPYGVKGVGEPPTVVSTAFARRRLGAPAALGRPYVREER